MRLFNILMTPPPPIPSHPPHTHTYTLIGCYWQSIFYSPLFILYANSPSTPFILLKKYYLWWNHLSTPCGFTLVLNMLASFLWPIRLQTNENCVWFVKYHFKKYQNKNKKSRVLKTYNFTWFLHILTFKYFIHWNSIPSLKKNLRN